MAIMSNEIGKALVDALGLPKQTVEFTLRCRANQPVRVECEYYPEGAETITTALMEYDLVPRFRARSTVAAPAVAEHPHFDTWMRHRVKVAHAKFMERTSYHPACDWRTFSPEAIERYINGAGL
jgi:hypothetical protein